MASGCSEDDMSTKSPTKNTEKKVEISVFPETKSLDQGQSFFRMFSIPRHAVQQEEEPKEGKILPTSQPMLPPVAEEYACDICGTIFRTKSGRTRHRKSCSKKHEVAPVSTEKVVTPKDLTSFLIVRSNEPQVWADHTYSEL
eukprot:TCONS_00061357-protein